jgi:hypothetical protein
MMYVEAYKPVPKVEILNYDSVPLTW